MASAHFTVASATDGGGHMIRVTGELDPLGAADLAAATTGVNFEGLAEVRVDCSGLTFLDSAGIAALVDIRNRASDGGAWFALDRIPTAQRRVIEIAGLLDVLQVDDDRGG